jgi:RNA recognition motif-containing protein
VICRRVRGFGFVEFIDERDAEDAERHFDGTVIGGRTITVSASLTAPASSLISQMRFHLP